MNLFFAESYEAGLAHMARHDPLTGVYNRYSLDEILQRESARSKRYGGPIGFLMIDVDHFKEINDRWGHQAGDEVLQEVAKLLKSQVRTTDIVVRYGGDEFLVMILEIKGQRDIGIVAKRITEGIKHWNWKALRPDFPISLSIGGSYWNPASEQLAEAALATADQEMYKNKRQSKRSLNSKQIAHENR